MPNRDDLEVGCVKAHFLDSGAFTLWSRADEFAKKEKRSKWDFYDTDEFWEYVDEYAAFIKKYSYGIDYYANVDAIPDPDITWRNQKYLEGAHGLNPIPVVHYKTDLSWLKKYIDHGYEYIALGGLVGSADQDLCKRWLDRAFNIICNTKDRLPRVKTHGFGVTTYSLLLRYPWYSVDSTTWTKAGGFGTIWVPHRRRGKFVFGIGRVFQHPYIINVSMDSPAMKDRKHLLRWSLYVQGVVRDWLDHCGIPLGKVAKDGTVLEEGVLTHHTFRRAANLHFFEALCNSLPKYPWPYYSDRKRRGFATDRLPRSYGGGK
jgi:hypothetical protein